MSTPSTNRSPDPSATESEPAGQAAFGLPDLLSGDGPFVDVADDFVDNVCASCRGAIGRQGMVVEGRYLCVRCSVAGGRRVEE